MMAFFLTMPISSTMPMMPITSRSLPAIISASRAPMPAEGSVDRIVTGWMKLSYSTPSTIYTATSAAISRYTSLDSESSNAWAAPCSDEEIDGGRLTDCSTAWMSFTAVLNDAPFARLNEIVTDGNCARWLITSGDFVIWILAMADSGTWAVLPVWLGRYRLPIDCTSGSASGLATRITRYWFDCSKMVETIRWPSASYRELSMVAGVMPQRAARC